MNDLKQHQALGGGFNRSRYLAVGVGLFLIKYAIDVSVANLLGRSWSPLYYLVWPNRSSPLLLDLPEADRHFGLVMLCVALPFIAAGVFLTIQRLRDAHLPLSLVLLFFVPVVNLLLILGLCIVPSRPTGSSDEPTSGLAIRARAFHRRLAGESDLAAFVIACVLSAALTVGLVFLSASVLASYGFGVFVAAPFVQGWLAAVLYGLPRRRSVAGCYGVAAASLTLTGGLLLACAIEGALCLLMASPLALIVCLLGAMAGHFVQSRWWVNDSTPTMIVGLLVVMPALMAAESATEPEPVIRQVRTEVVIAAPPDRVWKYVIAFPPLPEPTDLLFRSGIAYPQRAEIKGHGVGAVRYCVFSTGPFVEPIEVWDEPRCLAFSVTDQPAPMEELSPFHIHPPHLDNFLVSRRGQFYLIRLPDGRTRLEGTTWYTNRMWPASYWNLWSDAIIHRIHRRVLDHVKGLAEVDDGDHLAAQRH